MKDKLLLSAKELSKPTSQSVMEFEKKHMEIAARCSAELQERPDLDSLIGPSNLCMAIDNNRNFSRFMLSIFLQYDPTILVETVLWVFRSYRAHGFQTTYWAANLNMWVDDLRTCLSNDSFEAVFPFYNWLIVNIPVFVRLTDPSEKN